jgi:hypothetical protein
MDVNPQLTRIFLELLIALYSVVTMVALIPAEKRLILFAYRRCYQSCKGQDPLMVDR